jgi:hypothetical protein
LKDISNIIEDMGGSVDPRESLEDCITVQEIISFLKVGLNKD